MPNYNLEDFKKWLKADPKRTENIDWSFHFENWEKLSWDYIKTETDFSIYLNPEAEKRISNFLLAFVKEVDTQEEQKKKNRELETKLDLVKQKLNQWTQLLENRHVPE